MPTSVAVEPGLEPEPELAPELAPELHGFRRDLLVAAGSLWRDFPWRATRDPWLVLVSEVMLQQTQASRVVEPYLRVAARFGSPAACAAAGPAEVVREWEGLGYNRRAVHLHRAAVAIVERHGGEVPGHLDSLLALPGVGPYTARAVLALAFGAPVGIVDTNVARVLARAVAGRPLRPRETQELADRLAPADDVWRFTQALFDLGAGPCAARAPSCGSCPVARDCRWAAGGHRCPDPAAAARRRQSEFEGSDREGRGRLVRALRRSPVHVSGLAAAAGWPGDSERALRVAAALVHEGLAGWAEDALVLV